MIHVGTHAKDVRLVYLVGRVSPMNNACRNVLTQTSSNLRCLKYLSVTKSVFTRKNMQLLVFDAKPNENEKSENKRY